MKIRISPESGAHLTGRFDRPLHPIGLEKRVSKAFWLGFTLRVERGQFHFTPLIVDPNRVGVRILDTLLDCTRTTANDDNF